VRPPLAGWLIVGALLTFAFWGGVALVRTGAAMAGGEVRALRLELDSLLLVDSGLCRRAERTPLKSLKGLP